MENFEKYFQNFYVFKILCLQELKNEGILGIGDYAREFLLANEENVY